MAVIRGTFRLLGRQPMATLSARGTVRGAGSSHDSLRHRTLQGHQRGEPVHLGRVGDGLVERHEAEVVVAVGDLRLPAGLTTLTWDVTW